MELNQTELALVGGLLLLLIGLIGVLYNMSNNRLCSVEQKLDQLTIKVAEQNATYASKHSLDLLWNKFSILDKRTLLISAISRGVTTEELLVELENEKGDKHE